MAAGRTDLVAQTPRLSFSPLRAAAVLGQFPLLPFFVLLALRQAELWEPSSPLSYTTQHPSSTHNVELSGPRPTLLYLPCL